MMEDGDTDNDGDDDGAILVPIGLLYPYASSFVSNRMNFIRMEIKNWSALTINQQRYVSPRGKYRC